MSELFNFKYCNNTFPFVDAPSPVTTFPSFLHFFKNLFNFDNSKSTDFWGFYNGEINTTRIPSVNRYYMANVNSFQPYNRWVFYKGIGAIKKSNIHYGKIGLLKKVIYPTDGSTEFIYEGNSVSLRQPFHTRSTSYDSYHSRNIISTTSLKSSESYNFRYQYLKLANDPSYSFYNSVKNSISDFPTIYEEFEVGGARIYQIINKLLASLLIFIIKIYFF